MNIIEVGKVITFLLNSEEHTLEVTEIEEGALRGTMLSGNPHLVGLRRFSVPMTWLADQINPKASYSAIEAGKLLPSRLSPDGRTPEALHALRKAGKIAGRKLLDGSYSFRGDEMIRFKSSEQGE